MPEAKRKERLLTDDEFRKGCSVYVDHGGGIGFFCEWKPYIKVGNKIYCRRHNPIRLRAESAERTRKFLAESLEAEANRKANIEHIQKQERVKTLKEFGEWLEERLRGERITSIFDHNIEDLKQGKPPWEMPE